jgi:hypothetical protein
LRSFVACSQAENGSYWSNERGWTDRDHATEFSLTERRLARLPDSRSRDAEWIEIAVPPLGAKTHR